MVPRTVLRASGIVLTLTMSSAAGTEEEVTLQDAFPASGEVSGWTLDGSPSEYAGDRIFAYMNGAGEIPRSLGFGRLVSARYSRSKTAVEVVIFEMADSAAAYGYYSLQPRAPDQQLVQLDAAARIIPGYMLATWKGRYTIVVRAEPGGIDQDSLTGLARAVLARLQGSTEPPKLVGWLPDAGRAVDSEKYLGGKAAFDAEVRFMEEDVFGLSKGVDVVVAEYQAAGDAKCSLALLRYRDPGSAARAAAAAVRRGFSVALRPVGKRAWAGVDERDGHVGTLVDGRHIGLVLRASEARAVVEGLSALRKGLRRAGDDPKRKKRSEVNGTP